MNTEIWKIVNWSVAAFAAVGIWACITNDNWVGVFVCTCIFLRRLAEADNQ